MTLYNFMLDDYEEVVDMYYACNKELSKDEEIGNKYFYYKAVMGWINSKKELVIAKRHDEIVGFSISSVNDNNGLIKPVYMGETIYVKPEYRKTKAAYLLYKNVSSRAKDKKMSLVANGDIDGGSASILRKHFNFKETTITFERKI